MKKSSFTSFLATIAILGVVPTAIAPMVSNSVVPFARVSLNDVIKIREVGGDSANDVDSVLGELVLLNPDLIMTDVEITNFIKATETSSGSAMVSSKPDTNYTGVVGITIAPLAKIELSTVVKSPEVKGETANTPDAVLKEIGRINPRLELEYVEVVDFVAASPISAGSARVIAKEDTKYIGDVDILIIIIPKINLSDVIQIREVDGEIANDEEIIIEEIAKLNPALSVEDIEIGNFKAASEVASGLAVFLSKENTKYVGEVTVFINVLPKNILSSVITEREVEGDIANTPDEVLKEIGKLNPDLIMTDVEIRNFNKATDITLGSAIITAKANGKYAGLVGIAIRPLSSSLSLKNVLTDQEVVNEINSMVSSKSVNLDTKASEFKNSITGKFIKDRLSEDIANMFDEELFTLNQIVNEQGEVLSDADLNSSHELTTTINYDYGEIKNQNLQLVITVKDIEQSKERNSFLNEIKIKSDKNEDDEEWSDAWFNYFKAIESDVDLFSFQFPRETLKQNKVLQNIIYDEIKLVMETDFNFWNIEKGYDPASAVVQYKSFNIIEDTDEISASGRVSVNIRSYGSYVKHSVLFNYKFNYTVL